MWYCTAKAEEFEYLGTTLTNQNSIQEKIKSRLKSGNACYHLVQNLLSSSLLSKNLKIKVYRTITLAVVLYGCEMWSLTPREERRLRVFQNRVLRRLIGSKGDNVIGECRKLHNEELNDLHSSPSVVRVVKARRIKWMGYVMHMGERKGIYRISVGRTEGKRPLGRPRHRWEDLILRVIFRNWEVGVWTGSSWLRIGTGGKHLWMRYWIFGVYKMQRVSWLAANLLVSQEGLCSMEKVSK